MRNSKTFRDFVKVLLICILIQTPQVSTKGKFLSGGLGVALDVVGLGETLRGLLGKDNSQAIQDISDKLDKLQDTVDSILTLMKTVVEEVDIRNRLNDFDQIKRKIRVMGKNLNIILKTNGTERLKNIQIFLDSARSNYEVTKEIISVMFEPSFGQTESSFEILVRKNRCSHSYIMHFLTLVRNELEIGISVQLMYLSLGFNATLTQEENDWKDELLKFDKYILLVMNECDGQMERYLKEDLRMFSNITVMLSHLTERYMNYELIVVRLNSREQHLFTSNDADGTGVHYTCIQSCDSGKMCVIYKKKDNNDSAPTAVAKLNARQDNFPEYCATDGLYVIQSFRDLESEVDFYVNSSRFENYTQTMIVPFSETVLADDGVSEHTTCAGPYIHTMGASLVSLLAALLIGLMV